MKKVLFIILALVIILAIASFGVYTWYNSQINQKNSDSSTIAEVTIESGESVKDIAIELQKAGLIKNSDVFFIYVKLNRIAPSIQAGKFQIPQNLTIVQVADFIQKAGGNDIWITIPEGLRYDEIANLLETEFLKHENTKYSKDEFLKISENPDGYEIEAEIIAYKPAGNSIEGFLFPDTYNVPKDISSIELTNLLISTLEKKLNEEDIQLDSHKELSAYEVLTLASIIEREAWTTEQRYMISDILQKRLRGELDGVKLLQADATLLYELKDWEAVVTKELKEKDSEYNTYLKVGLIPTPISNPGIDSILSVLNPTSNEYFFYLHDEEGKIHYAKTNNEHINNQRCYINKNTDYCL